MIRIERIKVQNFRKFRNADFNMNKLLTTIAGANNAGKTSIVELMSNIFTPGRSLTVEDMNYRARKEDLETLELIISDANTSGDEKIDRLSSAYNYSNKIMAFISIQYDEDDQLSLFSKFLSDYDVMKKNYYFIVEYGYKKSKNKDIEDVIQKKKNIEEIFSSLESSIYYCNENGEDRIPINNKDEFYNLFNYHCVYALRRLSDTSDEKQNYLSKHLLKTVKNDESWRSGLDELVMEINHLLIDKKLSAKIDELTIDSIKKTLEDFSKTNGGNTGKLGIDFKLENQDIEKVILEFTKIYFEQEGGGRIKEQKQGLGYSNLIFLLLETQIFREKIDNAKVNLLVFEEPEAHLHPQMQNIFIQHLNRVNTSKYFQPQVKTQLLSFPKFTDDDGIMDPYKGSYSEVAAASSNDIEVKDKSGLFQLFITTHSSEMAKSINLSSIRVIRPINHIESFVFDLEQFLLQLEPEETKFYIKFFQFNMIEMVFADKLILFEGDAERLFLKYLIANDQNYRKLASQYISYIQVGGAYAYNYLKLINFLKIKTLILSDIDYEYDENDMKKEPLHLIKEVLEREISNQTIIKITGVNKVKDIFNFQIKTKGEIELNNLVCIKFQTYKDGYARTLEDAILNRLFDISTVFNKVSKNEFISLIKENNLQLAGPKGSQTTIRDRIDKLKQKTDFMYSLIENDRIKKSVPKYIEEGLVWLQG